MSVSIITAVYNNVSTIEQTLRSVQAQSYPHIEHIIIDGSSTDGTLELLKQYRDKVKLVSEQDNGIYDAMNKGIKEANGDIIGFLNGDDFYSHKAVIKKVVQTFEKDKTESVYGDLVYVDNKNTNKIVRYWKSQSYYEGIFLKGWMPPHPTFFVKKEMFDKYGYYNTKLESAADYELMLRFLHRYKISTTYIPEIMVKMRTGGKSNRSLWNRIKANREDRKAWTINGLKPTPFTLIRKPLSKIPQYFKKPKHLNNIRFLEKIKEETPKTRKVQ